MTAGNRSRGVRALAWGAIAVQPAFVAAWLLAGALEPGYSHADEIVDGLGAADAANPGIVNAATVAAGLSLAAVGLALGRVLPRRAGLAVAGFVAAGAVVTALGLVPYDCSPDVEACHDAWQAGELSAQHDAHAWLSLAMSVLLVATPFALSRALWPSEVAAAALTAGLFAFAVGLATTGLHLAADGDGLVQRAGWGLTHLWIAIVAGGVLHATRSAPRPGPLIPIGPREFFSRTWTGEGELVLRPFALGRRFPVRFAATRVATWLSEDTWRFDDSARFADGRVERRVRYCRLAEDGTVEITARDLPDGARVLLEAGGFRVLPFRVAYPLGPLPLLVECRDRSHVPSDGTFHNVTDACGPLLRIPLARVTFRMRPVEQEPAGAAAGAGRALEAASAAGPPATTSPPPGR